MNALMQIIPMVAVRFDLLAWCWLAAVLVML